MGSPRAVDGRWPEPPLTAHPRCPRSLLRPGTEGSHRGPQHEDPGPGCGRLSGALLPQQMAPANHHFPEKEREGLRGWLEATQQKKVAPSRAGGVGLRALTTHTCWGQRPLRLSQDWARPWQGPPQSCAPRGLGWLQESKRGHCRIGDVQCLTRAVTLPPGTVGTQEGLREGRGEKTDAGGDPEGGEARARVT